MIAGLKKRIINNIINIPGPKTKRKFLIIESDDWGATSIPNKKAYNFLLKNGIKVDQDPYCIYDNIATRDDFEALFNTLSSFKDSNNRHPVITANTIVANPDYQKINESSFREYYYETIDVLLEEANVINTWRKGIEEKLFLPQFHGREHLNVLAWQRELRNGNPELQKAFEIKVYNIPLSHKIGNRNDCRAALDFINSEDIKYHNQSLKEGLNIFKNIFGYSSESFIAPCYTWGPENEQAISDFGVKILQGARVQKRPKGHGLPYKKVHNYFGKKNPFGQNYIIRNALLEPALQEKTSDSILYDCLDKISNAFQHGKPAVVGMHRLNFIGSHDIKNRDRTLNLLKKLLKVATAKWPDLEFISTNELLTNYFKK